MTPFIHFEYPHSHKKPKLYTVKNAHQLSEGHAPGGLAMVIPC